MVDVKAERAAFVAADVGGTHARIGLVRASAQDGRVEILDYRKYTCVEYPGLDAILDDFIGQHRETPITRLALACAGYVIDGRVINDNLPWRVSTSDLARSLGLKDISLINDFEAVAYATQYVPAVESRLLTDPDLAPVSGPQVVVGPGTGLGSATILPANPRPMVLATEAGQIALAPCGELEIELLRLITREHRHVSYEHVLSGPGLLRTYRALGELRGQPASLDVPERITMAALRGDDAVARQALEVFCALLGSFVGDLAMLYGASGGVWLAGGILPQIRGFLSNSEFLPRFLDKGRMRAFLERVPIRLMEHGQLGVIGAAGCYLDRLEGA